jgi:hypothetical protein
MAPVWVHRVVNAGCVDYRLRQPRIVLKQLRLIRTPRKQFGNLLDGDAGCLERRRSTLDVRFLHDQCLCRTDLGG